MSIWVHIISNNVNDDFIWYVLGLSVVGRRGSELRKVDGPRNLAIQRAKMNGLRSWNGTTTGIRGETETMMRSWTKSLSGSWSKDFGTALGNFDLNMNAVIHRNTVMPWWNLDNLVWSLGPIVTLILIGRSANPDSLCEACQNRTVWLGSLVIWLRSNREPWTGEIIIHQINVDTQQLINLFSQLGIDFFLFIVVKSFVKI